MFRGKVCPRELIMNPVTQLADRNTVNVEKATEESNVFSVVWTRKKITVL
jgi:hypothetical protein